MLGLHRGYDALGGEARQILGLDRLDVLDAMVNSRGRPGRAVGVQRLAHPAVAGRMGHALKSVGGEEVHRPAVAVDIGPEGLAARALGGGLDEPAGP